MTIQTYYLDSNMAKAQALLYTPYRYSLAWREDASSSVGRYRITRLTEYVLGLLTLLFSYPLKIAGDFLERYAEQISVKFYEEERIKWRERFQSIYDNKGCQERIIEVLIKSRVKREDCSFQHILLTFLTSGRSERFLAPDGKESGFIEYINKKPSECLIIGYTDDIKFDQKNVGERFKNAQIPAYRWDQNFQKKLPQVTWFWLGKIDRLNMTSPPLRQQIAFLFRTPIQQ